MVFYIFLLCSGSIKTWNNWSVLWGVGEGVCCGGQELLVSCDSVTRGQFHQINGRTLYFHHKWFRFPLLYIRTTKFVRRSLFDETGCRDSEKQYCKKPEKIRTHKKFAVINLKFEHGCFTIKYHNVPKFSDRQNWANSADPDQTAPRIAVWSGSALFAIPSASFGCIILRKSHLVQLLGWLK